MKKNFQILQRMTHENFWIESNSTGELREKKTALEKLGFWIKNLLLGNAPMNRLMKVIDLTFLTFCIEVYNPFNINILNRFLRKKTQFVHRILNRLSKVNGRQLDKKNILLYLDRFIRSSLLQKKIILQVEKAVRRSKEPDIIKEIKEAMTKGIQPLLITVGISGAYWMRGKQREICGIFKPFDEEIHAPNNPIGPRLQGALGDRRARRGIRVGESFHREVAAYLVDQYFSLGIVPKTYYASFSHFIFYLAHENIFSDKRSVKTKYGSFQEYVDGFAPIHKILQEETKKIPLDEYQLLVVFDVIIGNADRNMGNFLVAENKIAAIDHGLSFPDIPGSIMTWYWSSMDQGKTPLYPSIKKIIVDFPFDELSRILRKNCFFSINILERMRERVALFRAGVKKDLSPCDLAGLMRSIYLEPLSGLNQTLDVKANEILEKYLMQKAKDELP